MLDRGNTDENPNSDARGNDTYSQSPMSLKPILDDGGIGYPPDWPYARGGDNPEKDVEVPPRAD